MTSIEEKALTRVNRYLRDYRIPREVRILVGYSGGPDSTALAAILCSLRHSGNLVLAYLDHGIRPAEELAGEHAVIERFAESFALDLHTESLAPGKIEAEAAKSGFSVEEVARRYRYDFLERTADSFGCSYIALGHTADDQVETVITRALQGSGPAGLKGIPAFRNRIIRPCIGLSKEDILGYLDEKRIGYSTDSTNWDADYLRNRVRRELLPLVEDIFPGYVKSIDTLAEKMSFIDDFLGREADFRLIRHQAQGEPRMSADDFIHAHPALRLRALYLLYNRIAGQGGDRRLPYGAVRPGLFYRGGPDGRILQWKNYALRRCGGEIFWEVDVVFEGKKQYVIVVDKSIDLAVDKQLFHVRLGGDEPGEGDIIVRAAEPPLLIRSKRDGDRLLLAEGRVELNKLFGSWKVLPAHRRIIPVLEDREGIVAVLGEHLGYRNRYRAAIVPRHDETVYRLNIEVL